MFEFQDNLLFADAPVAYSVLDSSGRHIAANRKFWELFGYPPDTSISVASITHSDSQLETASYLTDLVQGDRESVVVEKQYLRADGSEFWGRLTAQRLLVEGQDALILGVIEDIDQQRELEAQLRRAVDDQSEFVARVSHELRNPLHTIAGLAELLTTSDIDEGARRHATVVLREARALTSIVSDLLDIGKSDSGNLVVEAAPFAIRSTIDRAVRTAQEPAAEKALQLNVSVGDAVPIYVVGDHGRIGQVLGNLIGNAIKFTAVGSVSVDVRSGANSTIEFKIVDTGPGIPEDRHVEIFEPFQRLNPSAPGAGLGLAISARLALSMGGSLSLLSSGPEGSTFLLAVPLPETATLAKPDTTPKRFDEQKTSRILVVEDNTETQMLASAQLQRLGYEHDIVGDGYQALEISAHSSYGAVLMDWHLPGIDGLETIRRMRQRETREGRERTPIISVTARVMAADIEACKEAGADDFVAKPASIARIGQVLERWTGRTTMIATEPPAVVDTDVFSNLLDELGDPELVVSLARTFLGELPRRVSIIVESGTENNAAQLAAHTLKSTSAMVGAEALRAIAAKIEESARTGTTVTDQDHEVLMAAAASTNREVLDLIERLETVQ